MGEEAIFEKWGFGTTKLFDLEFFFKLNSPPKSSKHGCTKKSFYGLWCHYPEWAKPRFATLVKYGKVELVPPTPIEVGQAVGQLAKYGGMAATFGWRNVTVRDAALNMIVATECLLWFFMGECLGKGTIVGYQVTPFIWHF